MLHEFAAMERKRFRIASNMDAGGERLQPILCLGERCQRHHRRMGSDELQGFAEQALAWFLARPWRGSGRMWQGDEVKLMASRAGSARNAQCALLMPDRL